ncbi:HAD family hydrolase [Candidatus Falkowbacteria bacterium]|nr:HAD family hydrolase [Candidatus Falkowbacteria bacterium]
MDKIYDYQCYLFDFDGVIVDTVEIKAQAFAEIYRPCGDNVVEQILAHHRANGGASRIEKFRYYHQKFLNKRINDSDMRALSEKFSAYSFKKILIAPLVRGAEEFLNNLRQLDKKIFIVSSAPEEEIKKVILKKQLKKHFCGIKGAPLSKHENINQIRDKYNFDAAACVFFGDAAEDQRAAESHNIKFVPINYFDKSCGYPDFRALIDAQNQT